MATPRKASSSRRSSSARTAQDQGTARMGMVARLNRRRAAPMSTIANGSTRDARDSGSNSGSAASGCCLPTSTAGTTFRAARARSARRRGSSRCPGLPGARAPSAPLRACLRGPGATLRRLVHVCHWSRGRRELLLGGRRWRCERLLCRRRRGRRSNIRRGWRRLPFGRRIRFQPRRRRACGEAEHRRQDEDQDQ